LNALFNERQRLCNKLEGAVTRFLSLAMKAWRAKASEKRTISKSQVNNDVEQGVRNEDGLALPVVTREFLDELVPRSKRPTHTLGFMCFGGKVDTIDWCKVNLFLFIVLATFSKIYGTFRTRSRD
jgi:calcium permeable stress-gated cation channel